MDSTIDLSRAAAVGLAKRLADRQRKIVLAESCTAGLAAALLGECPGISAWFCGSAVTYREATKIQWLDVPTAVLKQFSAESLGTTQKMAQAVLEKTPEADFSAAITGHLGPQAPVEFDGKIFMAIVFRDQAEVKLQEHQLEQTDRSSRQHEAAACLLRFAGQVLSQKS